MSFLGCNSPRTDKFAGTNVSSIVIELRPSLLTRQGSSDIGVWATTNKGNAQVDRMGRPAIATVFIPNNPFEAKDSEPSQRDSYNKARPANDQSNYRGEVVDTLETLFSLNDIVRRRHLGRRRQDQRAGRHAAAGHPHVRHQQVGGLPERSEARGRRHRRRARSDHRGRGHEGLRRRQRQVVPLRVPVPGGTAFVGDCRAGEGGASRPPRSSGQRDEPNQDLDLRRRGDRDGRGCRPRWRLRRRERRRRPQGPAGRTPTRRSSTGCCPALRATTPPPT